MKTTNRDLLVLVKDEYHDQAQMENELEQLNQLLIGFETMANFCLAHEVFDLNKYKVIYDAQVIQKLFDQAELKSFVFIFNKN